jgi:OmpA-OmpF porin, OOP family
MSKKILYLLGIAITIIIGTILYVLFCCNCCKKCKKPKCNKNAAVASVSSNLSSQKFNYQTDSLAFACKDNILFLKNGDLSITPYADSVGIGLNNLKNHLIQFPSKKLEITGYATSTEVNNTSFENLGLARANDIKEYLIKQGVPANQLSAIGKIQNEWEMRADTLVGPIRFDFDNLPLASQTNDAAKWKLLKDEINADPLILYFESNKSNDNLSAAEQSKLDKIVDYASHVPEAMIEVVGHSDSSGNREQNIVLSKNRASFSSKQLTSKGVADSQIEVTGKGPDEPIADNATVEGRAKNRRTEIKIK